MYYHAITTLHASEAAAQCIVIGSVCVFVCGFVCLWVSGSITTITRNSLHRSSETGFIGKGSDHRQLIKFWSSCAPPGKGVCDGAKIFGSALLQPARSVCVSSECFFHCAKKLSRIGRKHFRAAPGPSCWRPEKNPTTHRSSEVSSAIPVGCARTRLNM